MVKRLRGDKDRNFFDAFGDAFGEGREEYARAFREGRVAAEKSENAPRWTEMTGAYPTGIRAAETAHEMAGKLDKLVGGNYLSKGLGYVVKEPNEKNVRARNEVGIGREEEGKGRRLGQNLGTLAGDLVTS